MQDLDPDWSRRCHMVITCVQRRSKKGAGAEGTLAHVGRQRDWTLPSSPALRRTSPPWFQPSRPSGAVRRQHSIMGTARGTGRAATLPHALQQPLPLALQLFFALFTVVAFHGTVSLAGASAYHARTKWSCWVSAWSHYAIIYCTCALGSTESLLSFYSQFVLDSLFRLLNC